MQASSVRASSKGEPALLISSLRSSFTARLHLDIRSTLSSPGMMRYVLKNVPRAPSLGFKQAPLPHCRLAADPPARLRVALLGSFEKPYSARREVRLRQAPRDQLCDEIVAVVVCMLLASAALQA
jgi:hypothetical protein